MTSKLKATWAAITAGFTAVLAGINIISPSLQDKFVQALQAIFPVDWRPEIVAICGFLTVCAGVYAIIHAAHSGPSTPPSNPPTA